MKIIDNRTIGALAGIGDLIKAFDRESDPYYYLITLSEDRDGYVAISLDSHQSWDVQQESIDDVVESLGCHFKSIEIIDKSRVTLTIE